MNKTLVAWFAFVLVAAVPASGKHTTPPAEHPSPVKKTEKQQFHPAIFPKLIPLIPMLAPVEEHKRLATRVSHNESFPPLPIELRPGATWDESKVAYPTAKGKNIWYKVPKWLSGEYSYGTMEHYFEKNLQTGEAKTTHEIHQPLSSGRNRGILVDKAGNIWQKAYGGQIGDPSSPSHPKFLYERYDDELVGYLIASDQYVENSAGIEFYVGAEDKKIIAVMRWQRIREFQLKDGKVMVSLSEQKFDVDGQPLLLFKSRGQMTKREDFAPLAPGEKDTVAGSYADAVTELRAFMDQTGNTADAPDAVADAAAKGKDAQSDAQSVGEQTVPSDVPANN
jgi:hypothetical protein